MMADEFGAGYPLCFHQGGYRNLTRPFRYACRHFMVGPAVSDDLREIQRGQEEHSRDNSQQGASAKRGRFKSNCVGGWHTN
jgi:hypothetical protein